MTISATKLTDNDFNIIVKANGIGSEEEQTLVDVVISNKATSEPKVSVTSPAKLLGFSPTGPVGKPLASFINFLNVFIILFLN